jgi:hypothetical protein
MGLETRQTGRPYYYRSRRDGRRVRKEYLGCGSAAEFMALIDERRRQEAARVAEARRAALAAFEEEERPLADLCRRIETLARAELLADGCRRHDRGESRRRRGKC